MKKLREIWNEIDPEVQVFYQTMGEFFVVFAKRSISIAF